MTWKTAMRSLTAFLFVFIFVLLVAVFHLNEVRIARQQQHDLNRIILFQAVDKSDNMLEAHDLAQSKLDSGEWTIGQAQRYLANYYDYLVEYCTNSPKENDCK